MKNKLCDNHTHQWNRRINASLRIEFIPIHGSFHCKVCLLLVYKCLCLSVGLLASEVANESMLPNLIMPSLNVLRDGPGLLSNIHVYHQAIFLDTLGEQINSSLFKLQQWKKWSMLTKYMIRGNLSTKHGMR